jgi:hypothetical protein
MPLVDLLDLAMLRRKRQGLSNERRAELDLLDAHYRDLNAMAIEWDLPQAWVVCPHCGEQAWVMPPHGMEPCPLIVQTAEQLGTRIDAERMMAVRTGINIEEMSKQIRTLTAEQFGLDEEDDE